MKKKKILALILCITMAFACILTGCKDDKDTSSQGGGLGVGSSEEGQWTGVHRP